jgi:DNA-binding transcriptional ArsR family regulator
MGERLQARSACQLDAVFGALSHPARRAMIERLSEGRATVTQIADQFPESLNTVSRHLKVLESAGLVERSIEGREHHLSVNLAHLMEAMQWAARQADFWHRRLDALESQVSATASTFALRASADKKARTLQSRAKTKRGSHGPTD